MTRLSVAVLVNVPPVDGGTAASTNGTRNTTADVNVIALVGERGKEAREFFQRDLGEAGLKRSVVIVATSDRPALVRIKAAFVATRIAEYFRDQPSHLIAASSVRDILATYKDAEDLVNIAAYVAGSNSRVDHALARIDAVPAFLRQDIYEAAGLDDARAALMSLG